LKLDIEGAEYDILEKMVADGTIKRIDELFIEFHWDKCGIAKDRHDRIVAAVEKHAPISYWSAGRYKVHKQTRRAVLRRALQLASIWPRHLARLMVGH
jgi:hypothetical protein